MILDYEYAKNKLLASDIDGCQQFFEKKGYILEAAYCELLNENLLKAKALFQTILEQDIRAHWGLFIISLIEGNAQECPSYFEIRNFLEIDLNLLIEYYKGEYVEKIIRYTDYMFTINPEVYKFIGRVFWNNDLKEQAMFFLDKAKYYFYHDPELHYLLAYVYMSSGERINALKCLNDCLMVLPNYYPAVNLLNKLKNYNV
ncbi:MAG: tetratricopeptide repeat protein [Candidatus Gastranaerophilaceae bacterium]